MEKVTTDYLTKTFSLLEKCSPIINDQTIQKIKNSIENAIKLEKIGDVNGAKEEFKIAYNELKSLLGSSLDAGVKDLLTDVQGMVKMKLRRVKKKEEVGHVRHISENINDDNLPSKQRSKKKSQSQDSIKKKILFFDEHKIVYLYSNSMPPNKTSMVLNGFVSQKVKKTQETELSILYRQCVRSILVPIKGTKIKQEKLISNLKKAFQVTEEIHNKILEEEKPYNSSTLLAFLESQLDNLSNHPYYTQSSFCLHKDSFKVWKNGETQRIKKHISKMEGIEASEEVMDVIDTDDDGFPWYRQLFTSLYLWGRSKLIRNKKIINEIDDFVMSNQVVLDSNLKKRLHLMPLFKENHSILEPLFNLSAFSNWLLDDYAERHGIRAFYRKIVRVNFISKDLKVEMRDIFLLHYLIEDIMDDLRNSIYNDQEFEFCNQAIRNVFKEVKDVILSNILRYFNEGNLNVLKMCIKLLKLTCDCKLFIKSKTAKPKNMDSLNEKFSLEKIIPECIKKSFQNWYKETLYLVESKNFDYKNQKDDDRVVPVKPAFLEGSKTLTPRQLLNTANSLWDMLPSIQIFQNVFGDIYPNMEKSAEVEFFHAFYLDLKFFIRRYIRDFRTEISVLLAIKFKEIVDRQILEEKIEWDTLFGQLPSLWINNTYQSITEYINTCKNENWERFEDKPYSKSANELFNSLETKMDIVHKIKFLESEEEGNSYQLCICRIVGKSLLSYVELIYNLFIQEFPLEHHAMLHDIYLRYSFKFTGNIPTVAQNLKKKTKPEMEKK